MNRESRLIIYTNDAILLAISRFPLYIIRWDILSHSRQGTWIMKENEHYRLSSKITHIVKTNRKSKSILPIDEKLFIMPPGFTPKIGKLFCMGDEGRVLEFMRITLHPNFVLDESHLDVIARISNIWDIGYSYINALIKEIAKAEGFLPRNKTNSILLLDKVNNEEAGATNTDILWDIWDQIIQGGNNYAKTPICEVVQRTQVKKTQWEYSLNTQRPTNAFAT